MWPHEVLAPCAASPSSGRVVVVAIVLAKLELPALVAREPRSGDPQLVLDSAEYEPNVLFGVLVDVAVAAVRQDSNPGQHGIRSLFSQALKRLALGLASPRTLGLHVEILAFDPYYSQNTAIYGATGTVHHT